MTVGAVTPQIIRFTVPLIIGNFCVLTYNAADSVIVGRFVGANALAALGAASPVMNLLLFLIIGVCLGMSVLMGNYFGAGDIPKLKREISTALIAGGIFTFLLVLLGIVFSRQILALMHTPVGILDDATCYLQIIFFGLIFSFIYNIYASILRSMGNSNASLFFLIASALFNILLDLLFVAKLQMGIKGAAIATVIAEFLSALFCLIYVYKEIPILKFKKQEFVFDRSLLRQTIVYGSVTAMQQITLHLGKFLIQGAVNPLGINAIAAFNAVNKIDDFVLVAQQNIAHGTTGFISQNFGANNRPRIRKGFFIGIRMIAIYSILLMFFILLLCNSLMKVFVGNEGEKVVEIGVEYLKIQGLLYLLPGATNIIQGYFRGIGRMKITLNSTFVQITGRVIAAYLLAPIFGVKGIALACLIGWICMLGYELPFFRRSWQKLALSE